MVHTRYLIYTPRLQEVWPKDLQCNTISTITLHLHLGEMKTLCLKIKIQDSIDVIST
jgi:hypothetical protein